MSVTVRAQGSKSARRAPPTCFDGRPQIASLPRFLPRGSVTRSQLMTDAARSGPNPSSRLQCCAAGSTAAVSRPRIDDPFHLSAMVSILIPFSRVHVDSGYGALLTFRSPIINQSLQVRGPRRQLRIFSRKLSIRDWKDLPVKQDRTSSTPYCFPWRCIARTETRKKNRDYDAKGH